MNVKLSGSKDERVKQELERAARFYAKELLSRQMLPYIEVDISIKRKLPDLGYCTVAFLNDWNKPRFFDIELRHSASLERLLKVLAHEMVHLKQFARCELSEDHTRWRGFHIDPETIPYEEQPWEIEAATMEGVLYILYREEFPINNGQNKYPTNAFQQNTSEQLDCSSQHQRA